MHTISRSIRCIATIALAVTLYSASAVSQTITTFTKALGENPQIRVLVIDSMTSICVTPKPAWVIKDLTGKKLRELAPDQATTIVLTGGELRLLGKEATTGSASLGKDAIVLESPSDKGTLGVRQVPYGVGWWWESAEDRLYQGRVEIYPTSGGKLVVIVVLPLEQYLRGVVPSEIGADSPLQALCAQAVAARSAAILSLTSTIYSGPHSDICSDVACQAFSGVSRCTAASDNAVTATRGQILSFEGRPVSAYYASNCGGYSDDIRNIWPDRANDRAYWKADSFDGPGKCEFDLKTEDGVRKWLEASPDCFCNPAKYKVPTWATKNFRWTREVTVDELTSRVALKKDVGRVREIRAIKRGPSGRMIEAEFVGDKGSLKIGPELAIRQVFDPPLKSAAFVVDMKSVPGKPDTLVIEGAGWGHGVGMCQTGAVGMANAGIGFGQILNHYYPNATIEKLY